MSRPNGNEKVESPLGAQVCVDRALRLDQLCPFTAGTVDQSSNLQCTILIGDAEPLVFGLLRLGHEITAAGL